MSLLDLLPGPFPTGVMVGLTLWKIPEGDPVWDSAGRSGRSPSALTLRPRQAAAARTGFDPSHGFCQWLFAVVPGM